MIWRWNRMIRGRRGSRLSERWREGQIFRGCANCGGCAGEIGESLSLFPPRLGPAASGLSSAELCLAVTNHRDRTLPTSGRDPETGQARGLRDSGNRSHAAYMVACCFPYILGVDYIAFSLLYSSSIPLRFIEARFVLVE